MRVMSSSNRRRDLSPSRGGVGSSKLRMDRQPIVTRISGSERHHAAYHSSTAANDRTDSLLISPKPHLSIKDPSLTIGRRKEIDNVMKKARAATNDYWDKKLLEVEEKDPNRWRHTGYKKMYIEGESSSESDRDTFRYNRNRNSRSRSRNRKSPQQLSPTLRKRGALSPDTRRRSPPSPLPRGRRTPDPKRPRSPDLRRRPRSPPEPPARRKSSRSPRSPINVRKHTSPSPLSRRAPTSHKQRALAPTSSALIEKILPRSKRPPSPPHPKV